MGCAIRTGFSSRGEPASIGVMESQLDWHNARALLEWQVDLGATEAIQEQPVDRFALDPAPVKAPKIMPSVAKPPAAPHGPAIDSVAVARGLAEQSQTLEELAAAIGGFELCELRKGARNLVFGEGQTGCDVMIIGDVPGREDDLHGKPFLGPPGQLLDKMLEHYYFLFFQMPEFPSRQVFLGKSCIICSVQFFNGIAQVIKYPSYNSVTSDVNLNTDILFGFTFYIVYSKHWSKAIF